MKIIFARLRELGWEVFHSEDGVDIIGEGPIDGLAELLNGMRGRSLSDYEVDQIGDEIAEMVHERLLFADIKATSRR